MSQNPAGVWDSNYGGVYHLGQNTALSIADSTGLRNGANTGAIAAPGVIGGGAAFNGAANIYMGSTDEFFSGPEITLSAWFNTAVDQGSSNSNLLSWGNNYLRLPGRNTHRSARQSSHIR